MPNSLVTISRAWLAAAFSLLSSCTRRSRAACSAHLSSHSDPVRWTPAQRDGFQIALDSIIVTTLMTGVRIGIAILTGSLSVLAAAADSGMDVTASVVTWLAVRLSSKPPDRNHLYGHGKAENFSALTEAILMLGASAVIGRVAVRSLLLPPAEVSASLWAFVTMALSLGVDLYRSRALGVAAPGTAARPWKRTPFVFEFTSGAASWSCSDWPAPGRRSVFPRGETFATATPSPPSLWPACSRGLASSWAIKPRRACSTPPPKEP